MGGDIIAGGVNESGKPWQVSIEDAKNNNRSAGFVDSSKNGFTAVATSGIEFRRGIKSTNNWHHIIDPQTLKPADTDLGSATIVAESLLQADVLASCLIILGSKQAEQWLKSFDGTSAMLQIKNGTVKLIGGDKITTKLDIANAKSHNWVNYA